MNEMPGPSWVNTGICAAPWRHTSRGSHRQPSPTSGASLIVQSKRSGFQSFALRFSCSLNSPETRNESGNEDEPDAARTMHNLDLILTLTGGFIAALAFGYVTHRIGLSPIVGYLLAGIVLGPNTPGFVASAEMAEQLAEIGVILLMFGVGLQFHFKELLAVKRIAIPGAVVQSLVATGLAATVMHGFGWSWPAGIVFGLAISVA